MKKILPLLPLILLIACVEQRKSENLTDQQLKDAVLAEGNRVAAYYMPNPFF